MLNLSPAINPGAISPLDTFIIYNTKTMAAVEGAGSETRAAIASCNLNDHEQRNGRERCYLTVRRELTNR